MYARSMMQNNVCDIHIEHIKRCKTMYAMSILNIKMMQYIAFDIANARNKMFDLNGVMQCSSNPVRRVQSGMCYIEHKNDARYCI